MNFYIFNFFNQSRYFYTAPKNNCLKFLKISTTVIIDLSFDEKPFMITIFLNSENGWKLEKFFDLFNLKNMCDAETNYTSTQRYFP